MSEGVVHKTKNYGDLEVINYINSREVVIKFIGYNNLVTTKPLKSALLAWVLPEY